MSSLRQPGIPVLGMTHPIRGAAFPGDAHRKEGGSSSLPKILESMERSCGAALLPDPSSQKYNHFGADVRSKGLPAPAYFVNSTESFPHAWVLPPKEALA